MILFTYEIYYDDKPARRLDTSHSILKICDAVISLVI